MPAERPDATSTCPLCRSGLVRKASAGHAELRLCTGPDCPWVAVVDGPRVGAPSTREVV